MNEFKPVRFVDVALEGQFWRERLETVLTRTIPSQHVQLGKHGILESLTLPNPPPPLRFPRNEHNFTVQVFWDSDVGKWIEAASYALSHRRDADIEAKIEKIVDDLEKAQAPDGYLNCWYLQREPDKRWTNLRDNHELYNLGHLLEGGIAYFLATGTAPAARHPRALCRACARDLRPEPRPEARLLRPPGDRAGADQALPADRREEASRPGGLFHQRARPPAALFRPGSGRARRKPQGFLGEELRVQPVAQAGARADQGGRPRGAGDVHVFRHGRPRRRTERRQPQARLRGALGRRDGVEDLHHLGARAGGGERRFYRGLRPAQRHGLCRDLRLRRADLLGAAHAASRPRRQICRRHGAGAVQRRADAACRATASIISIPIRWTATAATAAGRGIPARAAR